MDIHTIRRIHVSSGRLLIKYAGRKNGSDEITVRMEPSEGTVEGRVRRAQNNNSHTNNYKHEKSTDADQFAPVG